MLFPMDSIAAKESTIVNVVIPVVVEVLTATFRLLASGKPNINFAVTTSRSAVIFLPFIVWGAP